LEKVRRLDQRYPGPCEEGAVSAPTSTIGTLVEQLDVGTVVKASQAVSGEIEFGKLTETLVRIAVEHAGAERGELILFRGDELQIEAEATTGRGAVEVTLRHTAVAPTELPESVLHTAIRTRESVILDDATSSALFCADVYVQQRRPRSVLCLPLIKQAKLVGALYLKNNLTPHAFTPVAGSYSKIRKVSAAQYIFPLDSFHAKLPVQNRPASARNAVRHGPEHAGVA
jgi:hypothetical protein